MRKAPKPRLSSGRRIVVDTGSLHGRDLGASAPTIKTGERKEALPKRAARNLVAFTVLAAALLFLVYVVLATSVLVVMRADNHHVAVLRNVYPVGQVPAGALVYASSAPVDYSFTGKVDEAMFGVPAGSVVEVVTGPAATIKTTANGEIIANGEPTGYFGAVESQDLGREYVAICVSGACATGEAVIVQQNSVIGAVKGYVGLDGVTMPTTPTTAAHAG